MPADLAVSLSVSYRTACSLARRFRKAVSSWPLRLHLQPRPALSRRQQSLIRLHPLNFVEATGLLLRVRAGRAAALSHLK